MSKLNSGFLEQKYLTDMITYAWYCAGSLLKRQVLKGSVKIRRLPGV